MSNAFDDRAAAQENAYFDKQNTEALQRMAIRQGDTSARLSPVSGKPMVLKNFMGVVIDQCEQSGGVWLDAGELQQILKTTEQAPLSLQKFLKGLFSKE